MTRKLLSLIFLSFVLATSALAQEDAVPPQESPPVADSAARPALVRPGRDGLCAIDRDFFDQHPELKDLTQGELLVKGAELDITNTAMRLIPLKQNCSKSLATGKNDCMLCRANLAALKPDMVEVTEPLKVLDTHGSVTLCFQGRGDCPTRILQQFDLGSGLGFRCEYLDNGKVPTRRPWDEPMKSSPLLALGVKVRVPCYLLKPQPKKPAPWIGHSH